MGEIRNAYRILVVVQTGFRRTLGFGEGVSGIPRNIDENLGGLFYVFVIIFSDFL
jgi:hypothetical protein